MSNEWFDVAWINFSKAILHGQLVDQDGREITIERILTEEQAEMVQALNELHRTQMDGLLRGFAK